MTSQDAEKLRGDSKVLWGAEVWQIRVNVGHTINGGRVDNRFSCQFVDGISLDFQRPLPVPEGRRKYDRFGSLKIVTEYCDLRLQEERKVLAGDLDAAERLLALTPELIGSRLLEVQVDAPGGDTRFVFENGRMLVCFPTSAQHGTGWEILLEA